MKFFIFFCFLWMISIGTPAVSSDKHDLDPIVIHPDADQSLEHSSYTTTIPILSTPDTKKTLADILFYENGVTINRWGLENSLTTFAIRGSTSKQVTLLLNGIPVSNAFSGISDLSNFSLDGISKIEIYKDFLPPSFGKTNSAGAINLITRSGAGDQKSRVDILFGIASFQSYRASLFSSLPLSWAIVDTSIFLHTSKGDFSFLNNHNTPVLNHSDDFADTRKNNSFWKMEESLSISSLPAKKISWKFIERIHLKHSGIPGSEGSPLLRTNEDHREIQLQGILAIPIGQSHKMELHLQSLQESQTLHDPVPELFLGGYRQNDLYYHHYLMLSWQSFIGRHHLSWSQPVNWHNFTTTLYSLDYEEIIPKEIFQKKSYQSEVTQTILQDEITLFTNASQQIKVLFRLEKEFHNKPDQNWSYGAGLVYQWRKLLSWKNNFFHQYRYPTFQELYGAGSQILANTSLYPETIDRLDSGISTAQIGGTNASIQAEALFFYREGKNLISLIQNSQNTALFVNYDKVRTLGAETAANLTVAKIARLMLRYNYQESRNLSQIAYYQNKEMPFQPRHNFSLRSSVHPKWGEHSGTISAEYKYQSYNWLDRTNSPAYFVHSRNFVNLIVQYGLRYSDSSMELSFEVRNILNETQEDVVGYPLPGRTYHLSLRYRY